MKALFKIIVGLLLIIVLAVTAVFIFIDPNDYKEEITTAVKDNTGRDLLINGDMKLSLFPWVGIGINKVALSSAKGFGPENMLNMERMDIRLKIMPLLKKEVHIAKIVLDGLHVNLKVNKQGVTSWDDLTKQDTQSETSTVEKGTTKTEEKNKSTGDLETTEIPKLVLGGVEITNANVSFQDLKAETDVKLKNFNLIIGLFELGKPFEMKMDFAVKNGEPAVDAKISFGGFYTVDITNQHYQIKDMFLKVDTYGKVVPAGHQTIALNANADINLKSDKINLQNMTFKMANIVLNGQAKIDQALKAPKITAGLTIKPFDLRKTMEALKMELPEMADITTLTAISAKLNITTDLKDVQINDIDLQLDQTHLTGNVLVNNLEKPAVKYNLVLSKIDADRYLPAKKEKPEEPEKLENNEPVKDVPIILPVEMMRGLDIKGHFTAEGFKVMNLKTQQTDIGLLAKNGLITVSPLIMNMYKGSMDGKVIVDVRKDVPVYRFATKLNDVEVEPLMTDFMEMDKIQGKTKAKINVHTTGESVNQLKAALNGELTMAFKDGAIKGFNLEKELKKAEYALNEKTFDDNKEFPKTDFSDVTMSAIITDGVLKNDDFSLKAPFLRVAGAGTADLVKSELDYLVRALVTDKQNAQSGQTVDESGGFAIPVKITGKFTEPKISVLLADALAEKASQALAVEKARLAKKVAAEKAKLNADLKAKEDKIKTELATKQATEKAKVKAELKAKEDKLKAELKAKEAAEKKRIEDKLKNKLKSLF